MICNRLLLFRDHVWANFVLNILGKLKIPKIILMGFNASKGLNHIISNGPGCVLIISDDACDFLEIWKFLISGPAWRDFTTIFCQENASHSIRGSAEKDSS